MMHVAMRRDARRLAAVAPVLTKAKEAKVASWWKQVRAVIDWHHHTEDDILWPTLRERVPGFAETEKEMHADHAELDAAMDAVSTALRRGHDRDELIAAATRFENVIRGHLRDEEAVVLRAFAHDLSEREYKAIEQRVVTSQPITLTPFLVPWMLDGVSDAQAALVFPPPVRLIGGTALRWNYNRQYGWW